jgi:hypothetical protein
MQWHEQHPAIQQMQMMEASLKHDLAVEMMRPCNIKPVKVMKNGSSEWVCFLGERHDPKNIIGCGSTPEAACVAFDKVWKEGVYKT